MHSTGPSRPRGLLLASSAAAVVLLPATTAELGAAAIGAATALLPEPHDHAAVDVTPALPPGLDDSAA